ncbi:hypothetical protein [Kitasatospora cheerisanensis]|uniref:hypothetical protein n=1 Tax=Kitasatospora cheerisanensis TaxID=81942 RepID=UPI00068E8728|nr:hypothetical protein [Kitasatospora cheerisanensis]
MTTYAQAQETAEDWINAGMPRSLQREVRVREFDLGYVCWAVDGSEHEGGAGTSPRLVIARDSGASTLWPPLPVNEVVRQFEELYGTPAEPNPAGAAKPVRGAVEATSFLLSPPQWLQDAGAAAMAAEAAQLSAPAAPPAPPAAGPGEEGPSYFTGGGTPVPGTPVPPRRPAPRPRRCSRPPRRSRPAARPLPCPARPFRRLRDRCPGCPRGTRSRRRPARPRRSRWAARPPRCPAHPFRRRSAEPRRSRSPGRQLPSPARRFPRRAAPRRRSTTRRPCWPATARPG